MDTPAPIRIKATVRDGRVEVKALFRHVMETGRRRDESTGALVPAHYIREVSCEHNGRVVLTAYWGTGVSKNPYLEFGFTGGAPGDTLRISFIDNFGGTAEAAVAILAEEG